MHTTVHSKTASAHTAVHANAAGMMVRPVAATMLDALLSMPMLLVWWSGQWRPQC